MGSPPCDEPIMASTQLEGAPPRRPSTVGIRSQGGFRWAWQSIPVLQLPPVQTGGGVGAIGSTHEESSKLRPRSLVAKVESRVLQVKDDNGVEIALRAAEEILRQRRREAIGRWVNFDRNFVKENRCQTAGPLCCRRRRELEESENARKLREDRRAMTLRVRDARQRALIATRAMSNREMRREKSARDVAVAELVYGRIFTRTGGVVRAWTVIIANLKRLLFLQGAVERAARRHLLELNENRVAIVTRFMCRTALKRRRTRAVKVLVGALSAFTNSNAIGRYARRVNWGARHLQAVVRRRMACMSSHLILLSQHWDRLYPPAPQQATNTAVPLVSSLSPSETAVSQPTTEPQLLASTSPTRGKRPARKKGGGGQGGQRKGKGRQKRQQSIAGAERKGGSDVGGDRGGSGRAAGSTPALVAPDNLSAKPTQAAGERRRPPLYVCAKAKQEEILSWLQRTRSTHCREVINYERFTVFPCMVELLRQHERTTYCTRLAAIKHVTKLRATGRLSLVWVQEGYYARMAHVLPPPPRMPRMFTPEEGDEMFDRAAARSTRPSIWAAAANILKEEEPLASAVGGRQLTDIGDSAPSGTELIVVKAGAAAKAKAAAAGEEAEKLVQAENDAG